MKKILLFIFTILLAVTSQVTAGETGRKLSQESIIESIQQTGVLRVGMSTFVPWAMKDKEGRLVGFEIDVAKKLAKDMGVKAEFVPTKWSGIIPALLTGKFDVIIGGMGITPERNLKVNFSIPYDYTGMNLVANKSNSMNFKTLDDFNNKNVSIAVRIGTTAEKAARKFFPKARFRVFDNESQALMELTLGRVNAVVASSPLPQFQVIKNPDKLFLPISENFTKEPIGFAIRKGDYDALNFFNNWIRKMDTEGFFKEKRHYWFETKKWEELLSVK